VTHRRQWWRNRLLLTGMVIVTAVTAGAVVGSIAPPHDPTAIDIPSRTLPPGGSFLLGSDQYGRDILSRLLAGASIALSVGLVSVSIGVAGGVAVGMVAGFYGGWLGESLMRVMDGLYAFPAILLALTVIAVLGPGHTNVMVAIGVVNIPVFARLTRGSVLALRERDFVKAAQAIGGSDFHILRRHILPNSLAPLIVQASVSFALAILAEASLSYLGLGTQPPLPSWGKMLEEARGFMTMAPWMAIFPGLAIALTVLGFNFLADGLRDVLDPRSGVQTV